ncbi:uncharacterized protein LOC129308450 [Prosopis cineraria]|uniref:uncharacterized protein LOC129308450 n=1 Tax=Prosopis cineraria TaxID=364024 RepID=UPI002410AC81|nr:uncharacterized protein LOC129308450 [Prosopis cineraria]
MAFAGYPSMTGGFGAQPQVQPQFQPQMQPQFQPQMMQPQFQPQMQPQFQPQMQPHYNPYSGYGFSGAGMPPAPPASNHYHNSGTETIQGDTVQTGTFKGHGTGAKIQGGFTASGNIQ